MSYSFSIKADSKARAEIDVRDQLVKVCEQQKVHTHDCDQAQAAAEAFIRLLADDNTKDVVVNVSGSLGWESTASGDPSFMSANLSVQAYLTRRA